MSAVEIERIARAYQRGTSAKELAEKYEIHVATVYRILQQLGIPTREKRRARSIPAGAVEEARRRLRQSS